VSIAVEPQRRKTSSEGVSAKSIIVMFGARHDDKPSQLISPQIASLAAARQSRSAFASRKGFAASAF
jgi:hypothetical protein